MDSVIRPLWADLVQRCRDDPSRIVGQTRAVCSDADAHNPLAWSVATDSGVTLWMGQHPGMGGSGESPCPGDLVAMALATCMDGSIRQCADIVGLELDRITVEVLNRGDLRAILGIEDMPAPSDTGLFMHVEVVPAPGANPEKVQRVLDRAVRQSAVMSLIRSGSPVTVTTSATTAS